MTEEKIYIGTTTEAGKVYLTKHQFDCGWFWGFGYLGNRSYHYHFETYLNNTIQHDVSKVFTDTPLTQSHWWTLLELFKTAYTLRKYADMLHQGHSGISRNPAIAKNPEQAKLVNEELAELLDYIWNFVQKATSGATV